MEDLEQRRAGPGGPVHNAPACPKVTALGATEKGESSLLETTTNAGRV